MHKTCIMPTLQIRNLPQEVYERLKESAKNSRRSLTQEAIEILETALQNKVADERKARKRNIIEKIRKNNVKTEIKIEEVVKWIREDREDLKR